MSKQNPTVDDVRDFWDRYVCGDIFTENTDRFSKQYIDEVRSKRFKYLYHLRPFLQRAADAGEKILEIGCSTGMDSAELVRLGKQVVGVDLSPQSIEVAKHHFQLVGLTAELKVENAQQLTFSDNSFDVVYSFGVLHHTPNIEAAMDEVYRVLKPGGKAFIMLYARYSLNNLVHVILRIPYESPKNPQDDAPVTMTFSKRELRRLFHKFGGLRLQKRYLYGAGWRPISDITPRFLNDAFGRVAGWHWLIEATKQAPIA
jgi:ubiquinone/menaquinone biosynthesis C-methylase UbiE